MAFMQNVQGPAAMPPDLSGKRVLLVGGTDGIGEALLRDLTETGADIVLAGRNPDKLERLKDEVGEWSLSRLDTQLVDLAELASIRRACAQLSERFDRLDLVAANASVLVPGRETARTEDGFPITIGVNHLGNADLLLGLERPIRAARAPVVMITTSEVHKWTKSRPLADFGPEETAASGLFAYNRSKLANLLFIRALAQRWNEVTFYGAHPGAVRTSLFEEATNTIPFVGGAISRLSQPMQLQPSEASKGMLRILAEERQAPSGSYFEMGRLAKSSRDAADRAMQERLWIETMKRLGRDAEGALPEEG